MAKDILGPKGETLREDLLSEELAKPGLTGLRTVWSETVARGLTPARLARILRDAAAGEAYEYLTLAEEMEERELHYRAVLQTRRLAVSATGFRVEAASEAPLDQEIAAALREVIAAPQFEDTLDALLDALGKGYSVVEIIWDRSATPWRPARLEWRDPRWFRFDRESGRQLRLRADDPGESMGESMGEGVALPPFKFICHVPHLKTGLPLRGGLARSVAWSFMFKTYAVKDWMGFLEVYGQPVRLGRYGPDATQEDVRVLKRAVAGIGSDACAVLPESMRIDFNEVASSKAGAEAFLLLAQWLDGQVSKAVLGQTMTTDNGSSLSQAEVHNEVRQDIRNSDGRQLAVTLNRDLVRPFVDLNYGLRERYPRLVFNLAEPEDTKALAETLDLLVPLGLRVSESAVRDKLGLPDPQPGEALLGTGAFDPLT